MVGYLILGAVLVLVVMSLGGKRVFALPTWRIGSAMGAVIAFSVAGFLILRRAWPAAIILIVIGLWMAVSARFPRQPAGRPTGGKAPPAKRGRMSEAEARSILGVGEMASPEEIQAAYMRLMKRVHPDNGGAPGLAAQLNAARDRLIKNR